MATDYLTTDTELTSIANAIRTKGGTSANLTYPAGFVDAIDAIQTGSTPVLQTKSKSYTPSETAQSETVAADTGYDGLEEVGISVGAISSSYVGSGITRRSSSDLSASGAIVTAPEGYYASFASKSVASGTAGTPTASKGTVSNHSISVTPSVTNTTGYITGGTKTGTAVSVSASELVSGTYSVTSSGTKDVTNYASASVPAGTAGTPTATKGTVNNHSISVTPSVTNSGGYITGSTKTGTAVTVSASELVSGSETKTANGTYDVTNLAQLIVNVSGGGGSSKNAQVVQGTTGTNSSTLTALGAEMTVSKTGTYDVYWSAFRSNTNNSYTYATQLFVDGSAYGSEITSDWSLNVQNNHLSNVSLTANQKIRVYGRLTRGAAYYIFAPTLVIVES